MVGTVPVQLSTGSKLYLPSAPMVTVPTPGMVAVSPALNVPVTPSMVKLSTVRGLLSISLSLLNTLPVAIVSSVMVLVSATMMLGSSTGLIITLTAATSVAPLVSAMV